MEAMSATDEPKDQKMNNGQAFTELIKIQRKSPEHAEAAEALMQYITELAVAARFAETNLFAAVCGRTENAKHNHQIVSDKLDRLILQPPSHGGDI